MSASPYVPFYTSDFLAGTSGMTSSTKGVYITLICLMYEYEGPLTQKLDTLARRCGCTLPAFKKAVSDLQDDGKIKVTDEGLWSDKCNKHITQRHERSVSAKAAAKTRWEKSDKKQRADDATAMRSQCQPEPEPEPEPKNIKDTSVSLCNRPPAIDEIAEAVSAYNATASRAGWPQVQKITHARRSALKGRLEDAGGITGWKKALGRAESSAFLRGERGNFRCTFDFITKQSSFAKLTEGNYDDRDNATGSPGGSNTAQRGGAHHNMLAGFAEVANRHR